MLQTNDLGCLHPPGLFPTALDHTCLVSTRRKEGYKVILVNSNPVRDLH